MVQVFIMLHTDNAFLLSKCWLLYVEMGEGKSSYVIQQFVVSRSLHRKLYAAPSVKIARNESISFKGHAPHKLFLSNFSCHRGAEGLFI